AWVADGGTDSVPAGPAVRSWPSAPSAWRRRASRDSPLTRSVSPWAIASSRDKRGAASSSRAWAARASRSDATAPAALRDAAPRQATARREDRRHHPADLGGGLARPRGVRARQRAPHGRELIRHARLKRLTNPPQNDAVTAAGGQQHVRVEQARARGQRTEVRGQRRNGLRLGF